MIFVDNYKKIVSRFDYDRSYWNKKHLIHLIRKFLRENNGEKIKLKKLFTLERKVLYYIWIKNMPKDLFDHIRDDQIYFK